MRRFQLPYILLKTSTFIIWVAVKYIFSYSLRLQYSPFSRPNPSWKNTNYWPTQKLDTDCFVMVYTRPSGQRMQRVSFWPCSHQVEFATARRCRSFINIISDINTWRTYQFVCGEVDAVCGGQSKSELDVSRLNSATGFMAPVCHISGIC